MNLNKYRYLPKKKKKKKYWIKKKMMFYAYKKHKTKLNKKRFKHSNSKDSKNKSSHPQNIEIKTPEIICFIENVEQTLKFFSGLREMVDNKKTLSIDLKPLKKISIEAALVFVSEVDRFRSIKKSGIKLYDEKKWNIDIISQFNDIGMFELLNINITKKMRSINNYNSNIKFLKFSSGETANKDSRDKILTALDELVGDIEIIGRKHLQRSLGEAMTNTAQHAYPEDFVEKSLFKDKRWWVSASIDKDRHILRFSIYDQGKTIPGTLKLELYKDIWDRVTNSLDSNRIKVAIESNKSSINLKYRGKGLNDIKKYAEDIDEGELMVISRKGFYNYKKNEESITKELDISLDGTLISWKGCIKGDSIDELLYKQS